MHRSSSAERSTTGIALAKVKTRMKHTGGELQVLLNALCFVLHGLAVCLLCLQRNLGSKCNRHIDWGTQLKDLHAKLDEHHSDTLDIERRLFKEKSLFQIPLAKELEPIKRHLQVLKSEIDHPEQSYALISACPLQLSPNDRSERHSVQETRAPDIERQVKSNRPERLLTGSNLIGEPQLAVTANKTSLKDTSEFKLEAVLALDQQIPEQGVLTNERSEISGVELERGETLSGDFSDRASLDKSTASLTIQPLNVSDMFPADLSKDFGSRLDVLGTLSAFKKEANRLPHPEGSSRVHVTDFSLPVRESLVAGAEVDVYASSPPGRVSSSQSAPVYDVEPQGSLNDAGTRALSVVRAMHYKVQQLNQSKGLSIENNVITPKSLLLYLESGLVQVSELLDGHSLGLPV